MSDVIATRTFSMEEQSSFAQLSGDANPMHVDPVAARRTEPGEPIVHAIHAVLWALDRLCERAIISIPPASIDARFARFIYPGTLVSLEVVEQTPDMLRVALSADGQAAFTLATRATPQPARGTPPRAGDTIAVPSSPVVLSIPQMSGRFGLLPSMVDDRLTRVFANAARVLGPQRVKGLAALSALVGMVVPGMHSIFSRFDVDLTETEASDGALAFDVRKVDDRFRIIDVAVRGSGLSGTAYAFVRKPPVEQRPFADVASAVRAGEFEGVRALVIGGSRGLGAATAKIIAAGGGRVVVTYLVGEEEARALVAEIGADRCAAIRFDARDEPAVQLSVVKTDCDQAYYFAAPQMRRQKSDWFERDRFERLLEVQVLGFYRVCEYLHARSKASIAVFYPSTSALDDAARGAAEIKMSKAAGETLCVEMGQQWSEMRIVSSRLPAALTDQTAAVKPAKLLDAVDVMLPIVRGLAPGTDAETGVPQRA